MLARRGKFINETRNSLSEEFLSADKRDCNDYSLILSLSSLSPFFFKKYVK